MRYSHEAEGDAGACDIERVFTAATLPGTRHYTGSHVPKAGENRNSFLPEYRTTRSAGGKIGQQKSARKR